MTIYRRDIGGIEATWRFTILTFTGCSNLSLAWTPFVIFIVIFQLPLCDTLLHPHFPLWVFPWFHTNSTILMRCSVRIGPSHLPLTTVWLTEKQGFISNSLTAGLCRASSSPLRGWVFFVTKTICLDPELTSEDLMKLPLKDTLCH